MQNAIIAYAMNQREWSTSDGTVTLTATSDVTAAYGDDWPRYYARYIKYGKVEGRSGRTS